MVGRGRGCEGVRVRGCEGEGEERVGWEGGERCLTLLTGTRRGSAVYTPFTFFHIVILDASISRAKIVAE